MRAGRGVQAGVIGTSEPKDTVRDFALVWKKIKVSYRDSFIVSLLEKTASEMSGECPGVVIRAMCRALAATSLDPDGTFYLSSRLAAEMVGVSKSKAAYHLAAMVRDGELVVATENTTYRATRYRLGPNVSPAIRSE